MHSSPLIDSFQDLPEHFEDNMSIWMTHFLTLLSADNKLLQTQVKQISASIMVKQKMMFLGNIILILHLNKIIVEIASCSIKVQFTWSWTQEPC